VEALYEEVWGKSGARIILAMIEEPGFFDEPWDRIYHQMRDEWVELLQRPKAETGDFTKIPGLFGHVSCAYAEGDIEYRKKCKQIIDKKEKQ